MNGRDLISLTDKRLTWVLKAQNQHHFKACECETHSIAARELIEEKIMGYCLETSPDRNIKFSILSIGSGALLEEYVLLKKMIFYGFTYIDMTIIEKDRRWFDKFIILENIVRKINLKKKVAISLSRFTSFRRCAKANLAKKYEMIFAMDFEPIFNQWEMILKAGHFLKESGNLYLTAWNIRLTLQKNYLEFCEKAIAPEWFIKFNEQNKARLITDAEIRYGILQPITFDEEGLIDLIRICSMRYKIKIEIKKHDHINGVKVKRLCQSLVKFCPEILGINIVENFDSEKYDVLFPRK